MGNKRKGSPSRCGDSGTIAKHKLLSMFRRLFDGRVFSTLDCL